MSAPAFRRRRTLRRRRLSPALLLLLVPVAAGIVALSSHASSPVRKTESRRPAVAAAAAASAADPTDLPREEESLRPRETAATAAPAPAAPAPAASATPAPPARPGTAGGTGTAPAQVSPTPAPLPAVARRPLQPQIPVAPVQVDFARLQADLTALMADYGPRSSLWFEDLSSGRRLSLGADERFHPASTLKLPLVVALFEGAQQGRWTLDDRWAVNDDDWEDGAGDLQDVAAGSEFTLRELARRAIVDSDNIAANALLRKVGFEGVRISMRQAGAALTSGTLTSLSTADLGAVLSQLARRSAANPRAWQPLLDWLSHSQRNDWLPAPLPSSYTVFHKWGAYGGAENDAGIVSGPEARYVLVVFTDGTSDGGDLIRALSARVARAFPLPQVH